MMNNTTHDLATFVSNELILSLKSIMAMIARIIGILSRTIGIESDIFEFLIIRNADNDIVYHNVGIFYYCFIILYLAVSFNVDSSSLI